MQQTLRIDFQDRGRDLRRDALDLQAHHVQHFGQRLLARHGLEHTVLQGLVHLGARDVRQHGHRAAPDALVVDDGVAGDLGPVALALLAHHDFLAPHRLAAPQLRAVLFGEGFLHLRGQQGDWCLAQHLLLGPAEHAAEATIHIDDARLAVADDDCRIAGISHQRQALQVLLVGLFLQVALRDVGGHLQDLRELALGIAHGRVGGFQPATAAIAAHPFHHARMGLASAQLAP